MIPLEVVQKINVLAAARSVGAAVRSRLPRVVRSRGMIGLSSSRAVSRAEGLRIDARYVRAAARARSRAATGTGRPGLTRRTVEYGRASIRFNPNGRIMRRARNLREALLQRGGAARNASDRGAATLRGAQLGIRTGKYGWVDGYYRRVGGRRVWIEGYYSR